MKVKTFLMEVNILVRRLEDVSPPRGRLVQVQVHYEDCSYIVSPGDDKPMRHFTE